MFSIIVLSLLLVKNSSQHTDRHFLVVLMLRPVLLTSSVILLSDNKPSPLIMTQLKTTDHWLMIKPSESPRPNRDHSVPASALGR